VGGSSATLDWSLCDYKDGLKQLQGRKVMARGVGLFNVGATLGGLAARLAPAATPGSTAARVAVQPRALRDAGFMVYIGMCIFVSVYLLRRSYPDYFQQIATALPALLETPACSHLNTPAFSVHGEASH
jgi:hypothetical protein